MFSWLEDAANSVAGFFGKAFNFIGNTIKDAIEAVFNFAANVFDNVGSAWTWMVNGVTWFLAHAGDWAASVFTAIGHILGTVIPNAIAHAISSAVGWAGSELGKAKNFLEGALHAAEQGLSSLAHTIAHNLEQSFNFLTGNVRQVLAWIDNVAKKAVNLVLHPEQLLLYVIDGVGVAAWWLVAHALLPLVVKILRDSRTLVANLLSDFESILADLLH